MTNEQQSMSPDRKKVLQAIRDSWCAETCGDPIAWSPQRPSWQQCDASAFVAWEHLGGELVLGKVFLDGVETEHHYWNRIDGRDIDLTRDQFVHGEEIREVDVLTSSYLRANMDAMKPEVRQRIAVMRTRVARALAPLEDQEGAETGGIG